MWKSNTPAIATVSNDGVVSGGKEGLAEIVAYCSDNEDISFTLYVTVLDTAPTGILKLLDAQATFYPINKLTLDLLPKTETINSMLNLNGLKYVFTNTVTNFANFTVLSNSFAKSNS